MRKKLYQPLFYKFSKKVAFKQIRKSNLNPIRFFVLTYSILKLIGFCSFPLFSVRSTFLCSETFTLKIYKVTTGVEKPQRNQNRQYSIICVRVDFQFIDELLLLYNFLFCLRNPQDWSDGWKNLAARQHQPDGLLPCELWPPELETADPAAAQQPSSKCVFLTLCLLLTVFQTLCLFNSLHLHFHFFIPLHLSLSQIISVGNRAGLIDDAFNLARWVSF